MSIVVIDENSLQSGGSKQITPKNNHLASNSQSSQPQKETPILCEDSTIIGLSPILPSSTTHPLKINLDKIDSATTQIQEDKKKEKRSTFPLGKLPHSGTKKFYGPKFYKDLSQRQEVETSSQTFKSALIKWQKFMKFL